MSTVLELNRERATMNDESSGDYQELVKLRQRYADADIVLVEGA